MNSRRRFRMALLPVVLVCLPLPVSFAMHRSKFTAADTTSPSARPTAEGGKTQTFRVMTYNVENLFDTLHDAGFNDEEFLPGSNRRWNSPRYWGKQQKLARTIAAAGGAVPVDLVALCEVENDTVVNHLCRRTILRRLDYAYLVTQSKDARGIDVALLYQPFRFRLLHAESLRIPFDASYGRSTRDILHAAGMLQTGDTLDVFVCHLPSRRGSNKSTRNFRYTAARTLRHKIDSVSNCRKNPLLITLGDFNDEHTDISINKMLNAHPYTSQTAETASPETSPGTQQLYVLSANLRAKPDIRGTYKYQGRWNQLDHIIVNGQLLCPSSRLHTTPARCRIFAPPFLTEPDKSDGGVKPFRTYLGPIYHGGFSDHFPLVADFLMQ